MSFLIIVSRELLTWLSGLCKVRHRDSYYGTCLCKVRHRNYYYGTCVIEIQCDSVVNLLNAYALNREYADEPSVELITPFVV